MASEQSTKGILYLGAAAFALLLLIAWWFAASTHHAAVDDARLYAAKVKAERLKADSSESSADAAGTTASVSLSGSDETESAATAAKEAVISEAAEAESNTGETVIAKAEKAGTAELEHKTPIPAPMVARTVEPAPVPAAPVPAAPVPAAPSTAAIPAVPAAVPAPPAPPQPSAEASATTEIVVAAATLGAGDAAAGKKLFRKCRACHMIGDGAKNRVGPILTGIVDDPVGSREGFKYSDALKEAGAAGDIWTMENLSGFLTKPKAHYKGTKMAFGGFKEDADRANVIAYLSTFE